MTYRRSWFIACAALLTLSPATYAQQAVPQQAGAPDVAETASERNPAPSLEEALKQAPVSTSEVVLAVETNAVPLPDGKPAPGPDDRISNIAAIYGYLAQDFHDVTAVAPPTMMVFNTHPGKPDPYADMPASDAFKMLTGSLDGGQWGRITGKDGLGMSDLTTDEQRNLFRAMFPRKTLDVSPRMDGFSSDMPPPPKLTQDDLLKARLRIGQRVRMGLPIEGKERSYLVADAPSNGALSYTIYRSYGNDDGEDTICGVQMRATVPNTLKDSDVDYGAANLSTAIDLTGVKTVKDLITRIGVATHTELYSDARYEKKAVLLLGPPAAPAKDLLRALALCLRGTYRKVGSAYVLTNALVGVAARQTILSRFAREAEIARKSTVETAGDKAFQAFHGLKPSQFDDGLTMSDEQREQALKDSGSFSTGDLTFTAPLNQLTKAQQSMATDYIQKWNARPVYGDPSQQERLTTTLPLELWLNNTVVMTVPALPGPIVLDDYIGRNDLLRPSDKLRNEFFQKEAEKNQAAAAAEEKSKPEPPRPPKTDLAAIFARIPRRGVIGRPQTAAEVDKLIDQMQTIGLNQLWIDVYSHGQSRLDGASDILTEALAKSKGAGITVIPVLDPLNWGSDTPEDLQDITASGESSEQAAAWQELFERAPSRSTDSEKAANTPPPPENVFADPAKPAVRGTLTALLARLAAKPGVKTIAISGQTPPGYDMASEYRDGSAGYALGYSTPMRLSFLRGSHVDPIDLETETYTDTPAARWRLPEFQDWEVQANASKKWNEYRASVFMTFMRELRSAAPQTNLMVRARGMNWGRSWYGLWADPAKELPHATQASQMWYGSGGDKVGLEVHRQSPINVATLPLWNIQSPEGVAQSLKETGPNWDGFLIDLSEKYADPHAIDQLASSMAPEKKQDKKNTAARK